MEVTTYFMSSEYEYFFPAFSCSGFNFLQSRFTTNSDCSKYPATPAQPLLPQLDESRDIFDLNSTTQVYFSEVSPINSRRAGKLRRYFSFRCDKLTSISQKRVLFTDFFFLTANYWFFQWRTPKPDVYIFYFIFFTYIPWRINIIWMFQRTNRENKLHLSVKRLGFSALFTVSKRSIDDTFKEQ